MQKKFIALAVAALASGAAFAQSNVQVYGVADFGLAVNGSFDGATKGQTTRFDSGIASGSRLGFKGTEDLGNGLKALFNFEMGLNLDDGTSGQGRTFGRQSYVGLTGGFGTVIGGRIYTPHYTLMAQIDPFGLGTGGRANNLFAAGYDPIRVNNTAAYVSPNFNGFTVTAAYGTNALDNQESLSGNAKKQGRLFAIAPVYTNGPLTVGLNYHQVKLENDAVAAGAAWVRNANTGIWGNSAAVAAGDGKLTSTTLAGKYDFGVLALSAAYSTNKTEVNGADDDKIRNWLLGVSAPIGAKVVLKASYVNLKDKLTSNADAHQVAIGADYLLSKRTKLYTAYSKINNDDRAAYSVQHASGGGLNNESQFNVGINHSF
ncbi:porin [Azospira sp. I09]|uniref:porin n=1 Tax=Azospira sp. I09 TaxID=1765049 RepID=UPI0012609BFE|nr:porin [Azospira sp. I09]BBN88712.1 porin [Azospira sp. I09]